MDHAPYASDPRGLRAWTCLVVAALVVAAWVPLVVLPLHHDIGWELLVAGKMLDGQRLYTDIIEPNPPLIFWYALLAELIGRRVGTSGALAYHAVTTLIVTASCAASAYLLLRLTGGTRPYLRAFLIGVLAFLLGPFAGYQFGQREHLLLAGLVPYILGVAAHVRAQPAHHAVMLATGVLASFGLAMKPFFLPIWLGAEAYATWRRGPRSLIRPQAVGVLAGLAAYGAAALILTPDYLRLSRWGAASYLHFFPRPLSELVFSTGTGVAVAVILLLAIAPKLEELEPLRPVGALALVGLLLAVYVQRKGWDYHWYPVLALALLLAAATLGVLLGGGVRWPHRKANDAAATAGEAERSPVPAMRASGADGYLGRFAVVCAMLGLLVAGGVQSELTIARWGELRGDPYYLPEMTAVVAPYAPGGSILPLTTTVQAAVPLANHSGLRYASRFPSFWPMVAAYRDVKPSRDGVRYHRREEMDEMEAYVFDALISDLETRPELLVVDRMPPSPNLYGFDYVAYFGQSPRFVELFAEYEPFAVVGDRYVMFRRVRAAGVADTRP